MCLDELDEIKMCVAYELDGEKLIIYPLLYEDQIKIKPIYETYPVGNFLQVESKIWMIT